MLDFDFSVEHVLMFMIAIFLLYHLVGSCGCMKDGFSIGGKVVRDCKEYDENKCKSKNGCVWFNDGGNLEIDGNDSKCYSIYDLMNISQYYSTECESAFRNSRGKNIGHLLNFNITNDNGECTNIGVCVPNSISEVGWSDSGPLRCKESCSGDDAPSGSSGNWQQLGKINQSNIEGDGCYYNNANKSYDGCTFGNRALCYK